MKLCAAPRPRAVGLLVPGLSAVVPRGVMAHRVPSPSLVLGACTTSLQELESLQAQAVTASDPNASFPGICAIPVHGRHPPHQLPLAAAGPPALGLPAAGLPVAARACPP